MSEFQINSGERSQGRGRGGTSRGRGGSSEQGRGRDGGRGRGSFGQEGRGSSRPFQERRSDVANPALVVVKNVKNSHILGVIAPPENDRVRDNISSLNMLPAQSSIRSGVALPSGLHNGLVTNHFRIQYRSFGKIYQYNFRIFRSVSNVWSEDISQSQDVLDNEELFCEFCKKVPDLNNVDCIYDGRSIVYCKSYYSDDISVEISIRVCKYRIVLSYSTEIDFPSSNSVEEWARASRSAHTFLDTALNVFASNTNSFLKSRNLFFSSETNEISLKGTILYCAKIGYFLSLKASVAGLCLVCDMGVGCFFRKGPVVNILALYLSKKDGSELHNTFQNASPTELNRLLELLDKEFKGIKVRALHDGRMRKIKGFGPSPCSKASEFLFEGKRITVSKFFDIQKSLNKDSAFYKSYKGLRYPFLPTIRTGGKALLPCEFLDILDNQVARNPDSDILREVIKLVALPPSDRIEKICNSGPLDALRNSSILSSFGISDISEQPVEVSCTILPQAIVQYKNSYIDPSLAGSWRMDRQIFFKSCPPLKFSILVITSSSQTNYITEKCNAFVGDLVDTAKRAGIRLVQVKDVSFRSSKDSLFELFTIMKTCIDFVLIVLGENNVYGNVKRDADSVGLVSQCVKWVRVEKAPSGIFSNLMLKINTKCGGINHALINRSGSPNPDTFQTPSDSFSWLFDEPCMLVGIDVSHAGIGSTHPSVAALVGSMDGCPWQYAARLWCQPQGQECLTSLDTNFEMLLKCFYAKNKRYPSRIIVFRDGVGEGMFEKVFNEEVPAIISGCELCGMPDIKIAFVICQKGHRTRLALKASGLQNVCPGTVVDCLTSPSIVSSSYYEFYLTSHTGVIGMSKSCKYTLLFDNIGIKLAELELLTYWSTYLYCRANKSVSYATPAYYAHWLSKRGTALALTGLRNFENISQLWNDMPNSMFFV